MKKLISIAALAGHALSVIALASFMLLPIPAQAAVTATPVFTQTPKLQITTFVQGTDVAGTYKTAYTGGANGSKIVGIWITSNDGSASHLVTVQLSTSTSAHCSPQSNCAPLSAATVVANSGFANGTPAVNMLGNSNSPMAPHDSDGNNFLYLSSNTQTIEVTYATALTASTQLTVTIIAADF